MTVIEMTATEFFAVCVFALHFTGLGALGFWEARRTWKTAPRGERVMWCLGLSMFFVLPAVIALRAMAP